MASNLKIDDDLLRKAQEISGLRTKRETVNRALEEFIRRQGRFKILELEHQIDFDPDFDLKEFRKRS